MPSNPPSARRDVSVMCRECWTLVDGVEAGDAVRWTTCDDCADSLKRLRPHGSMVVGFWRLFGRAMGGTQ